MFVKQNPFIWNRRHLSINMKVKIEKTVQNTEVIISNLIVLTNRATPEATKYIAFLKKFLNTIYLAWPAKWKYFMWKRALHLCERIDHKVVPCPNPILSPNTFFSRWQWHDIPKGAEQLSWFLEITTLRTKRKQKKNKLTLASVLINFYGPSLVPRLEYMAISLLGISIGERLVVLLSFPCGEWVLDLSSDIIPQLSPEKTSETHFIFLLLCYTRQSEACDSSHTSTPLLGIPTDYGSPTQHPFLLFHS